MRNIENNSATITMTIAAALGIGFGLGLLFAPRSGAKRRRAISNSLGNGVEQVRQRTEDLTNAASNMIEKGKRTLDGHKETVSQALEGAQKAYREVVG